MTGGLVTGGYVTGDDVCVCGDIGWKPEGRLPGLGLDVVWGGKVTGWNVGYMGGLVVWGGAVV